MQGQSAVSLWSHFKDNSLGQGWVDGRWTGMWVDMRWGRIHVSLFSSLKKRKGDFLLQGVCAVLYISFSEAETVLWGLRLLGTALMWFGVPITVCMRSYIMCYVQDLNDIRIQCSNQSKNTWKIHQDNLHFLHYKDVFEAWWETGWEFLHKGDTRVLKGVDGDNEAVTQNGGNTGKAEEELQVWQL